MIARLEGQLIPVMVYSNADEVELSLNGRSLGRKKPRAEPVELPVGANVSDTLKFDSKYRLLWPVPYAAGRLQAVAYRDGVEVARDTMSTAGAPARIRLVADRSSLAAGGDDLAFVTVRVEDQQGNLCPTADHLLRFQVSGMGQIAAVDNGNAATVEPFHADYRKAFNGLALLIVRTRAQGTGAIHVAAFADGLVAAQLELKSQVLAPDPLYEVR